MDQQNYSGFEADAAHSRQPDHLEALSDAGFGAGAASAGAIAPPDSDAAPAIATFRILRKQIMRLLGDDDPRRITDIMECVGEGASRAEVRRQLYALKAKGLIVRPQHGFWATAKAHATSARDNMRLGHRYTHRGTQRKVLERLVRPLSAPALTKEIGVTRQRIYQVLQKLAGLGEIKRVSVPVPGFRHRWLWMRPDVTVEDAILAGDIVPDTGVQILNCLEPGSLHSIREVARAVHRNVGTVGQRIRQLEATGLVTVVTLGISHYVAIAPAGLDHPARSADHPKARKADSRKPFLNLRLAFVEKLAVLGEARTIDVTAALAGADCPGTAFLSGGMIARLVKGGLAEAVERGPGGRRMYRLTEAGRLEASTLARLRPPPARHQLEERIAAYFSRRGAQSRAAGLKSRERVTKLDRSPGQQAILDALAERSLSSPAIRAIVSPHVKKSTNAYRMLRTLEQRGAVQRTGMQGRAQMWSLRRAAEPASGEL